MNGRPDIGPHRQPAVWKVRDLSSAPNLRQRLGRVAGRGNFRGNPLPEVVALETARDRSKNDSMPDELPSLHIDTDWKKKAQEEKRKLAEEQKQKAAAAATPAASATAPATAPAAGSPGGRAAAAGRGSRETPPPSFAALVQSILTQALFYMGDLTPRGAEPQLNLDMAKHQIDTLGVLEEKTQNNLSADEQKLLDTALYETRMRFVGIASQIVNGV